MFIKITNIHKQKINKHSNYYVKWNVIKDTSENPILTPQALACSNSSMKTS